MESEKYTLNKEDFQKWGYNALVFAGPALAVLVSSAIKQVDGSTAKGAMLLYVLNVAYDLLRKYIQGK